MRRSSLFAPYAYGVLIGALFCWFSLWNGFPLITQDTTAYISRPASVIAAHAPKLGGPWADLNKLRSQVEAPPPAQAAPSSAAKPRVGWNERIIGGRSIYYGLILFALDAVGGLWGVLAFQAFVAGACVALLVWRGLGWRHPMAIIGLGLLLAAGTGAPVFAALAMPDMLAATTLLSVATLTVFWDRLLVLDRVLLALAVLAGCISHDSTLLVLAGLTACVGLAFVIARHLPTPLRLGPAALTLAGVLVIGIGASVAFTKALEAVSGYPPARLPYLTAHLQSTPVGAAFIKTQCEKQAWAVCAYKTALPMDWTPFLFGAPPTPGFGGASSQVREDLAEQDPVVAKTFAATQPLDAVALATRETLRQLVMVGLDDVDPQRMAPPRMEGVPPADAARIRATRLWNDGRPLQVFSGVSITVAAASTVLLAVMLLATWGTERLAQSRLVPATAVVALGLLGNAIVCGVLASPYDRFQARLIWLVPMLAYCATVTMLDRRADARPEITT